MSCSASAAAPLHPRAFVAIIANTYPRSVGTSTNCSAVCGRQATERWGPGPKRSWALREPAQAPRETRRSSGAAQAPDPPSAAQEHQGSERKGTHRSCAPRCAAAPGPAAQGPRLTLAALLARRLPRRTAGRTPGEEGASGTWPCTSSRYSLSLP